VDEVAFAVADIRRIDPIGAVAFLGDLNRVTGAAVEKDLSDGMYLALDVVDPDFGPVGRLHACNNRVAVPSDLPGRACSERS